MLRPGKTVNITRFSNQKSLRNAGNNIQQQEEWKHLPHFSYEGKKAREETIHFNLRLELVQTQLMYQQVDSGIPPKFSYNWEEYITGG